MIIVLISISQCSAGTSSFRTSTSKQSTQIEFLFLYCESLRSGQSGKIILHKLFICGHFSLSRLNKPVLRDLLRKKKRCGVRTPAMASTTEFRFSSLMVGLCASGYANNPFPVHPFGQVHVIDRNPIRPGKPIWLYSRQTKSR